MLVGLTHWGVGMAFDREAARPTLAGCQQLDPDERYATPLSMPMAALPRSLVRSPQTVLRHFNG